MGKKTQKKATEAPVEDASASNNDANHYEFRAEIKKLLDILSKSLYQNKEVFLRELVSNSSDALSKIRFIQLTNKEVEDLPLEIEICFDAKEKTVTVKDTGVGMTKQELIDNLGTIAASGSEAFIKQFKDSTEDKKKDLDIDIIGQFGVGFYSVFMIAQKVKVITKSYVKDEPSHEWESEGTGDFTIASSDRATRGTDVIIYLKEDENEYLNKHRLQTIIQKYSNYIPFPIFVKEEGRKEVDVSTGDEAQATTEGMTEAMEPTESPAESGKEKKEERKPVNELVPLWKRKPGDIKPEEYRKFYQFISKNYDDYFHVIHYTVEGQVIFNSILYVPASVSRDILREDVDYGLRLYTKKILIVEHCKDLIPKWMRFTAGMVDTEDIPLNVSRDTIQNNRVVMKINDLLVKKFIGDITNIAEKEQKKYEKFWKEYGYFVKEGVVTDHQHGESLVKLLRFTTSKTKNAEFRSLDEYIAGMKDEQCEKKEIYYLIGENLNTLRISPHMGYYTKNDIEVIFFTEPVDNFLMMNLHDYKVTTGEGDSKVETIYTFVPIDTSKPGQAKEKKGEKTEEGKEETTPAEPEVPPMTKAFLDYVKTVLGNKILEAKVSDQLYDNPYRLANPAEGMTSSMQRVMRFWTRKMQDKEFEVPRKIMEFNPEHPMVKELITLHESDPENGRLKPVIKQMFENCLLAEGDLPDPAAMVPRLNQLLEMLVLRSDDVKNPADDLEQPPEQDDESLDSDDLQDEPDDAQDKSGAGPGPEEPAQD
jgi:HSP90 family molecular chaperone